MDNQEVTLYAFLSYLMENNKVKSQDILVPPTIKAIIANQKQYFTIDEVNKSFNDLFGRKLPTIIIKGIFTRLYNLEKIKAVDSKGKYELADRNDPYIQEFINTEEKVDHFFSTFNQYAQGTIFENNSIKSKIKKFKEYCEQNVLRIIDYHFHQKHNLINSTKALNNRNKTIQIDEFTQFIETFLYEEVRNNQELVNGFELIFDGILMLSLYESLHNSGEGKDVSKYCKKLYLDTNVVLRILGYQNKELNNIGEEFYKLCKTQGCKLIISDYTLNEIQGLIRAYKYVYPKMVYDKNISHIYQYMKDKDVIPEGIEDFIGKFKSDLSVKEITIDYESRPSAVAFTELENHIENLARLKSERQSSENEEIDSSIIDPRYRKQADHDLKLIYIVQKLREKEEITSFEDCTYFFVTADTTARRYNKNIRDSQKGPQESIGDLLLSFLLYIKEPSNSKGMTARNFMVTHFKGFELSLKNWLSYVDQAVTAHKDGKINKNQLGFLISEATLTNRIIEEKGINDIIEESEKQIENIYNQMKKKEVKISHFKSENEKQANEILQLQKGYDNIKQEISDLAGEQKNTRQELDETKKTLETVRHYAVGLFSLILIMSMVFLFLNSSLLSKIMTPIALMADIIFILDYKLKFIFKT